MEEAERARQAKEMIREIRDIIDRLDAFHKRVNALEKQLRQTETLAEEVDLPRVRFALKDAFSRASECGQALVNAHLALQKAIQKA